MKRKVDTSTLKFADSPRTDYASVPAVLSFTAQIRETRKGRPLLNVKTEMNVDSKSTNERAPSLVGSLGLSCRYIQEIFVLPWLL